MTDLRQIWLVNLDKRRPALILTRAIVFPRIGTVTVAPITSRIRGLSTEVGVGVLNGLRHDCVVNCDNIQSVPRSQLVRPIGHMLFEQELALADAIVAAFDLTVAPQ